MPDFTQLQWDKVPVTLMLGFFLGLVVRGFLTASIVAGVHYRQLRADFDRCLSLVEKLQAIIDQQSRLIEDLRSRVRFFERTRLEDRP